MAKRCISRRMVRAIEKADWVVHEGDGYFCIGGSSPAGEDISLDIEAKTDAELVEELRRNADIFDVDDHVRTVDGMNGAPSSLSILLEDAQEIQRMYNELADAVEEAVR